MGLQGFTVHRDGIATPLLAVSNYRVRKLNDFKDLGFRLYNGLTHIASSFSSQSSFVRLLYN